MRDAKIMQLYEGTSQIQRLVIAKEVLMGRNVNEPLPEAVSQTDAASKETAGRPRLDLTLRAERWYLIRKGPRVSRALPLSLPSRPPGSGPPVRRRSHPSPVAAQARRLGLSAIIAPITVTKIIASTRARSPAVDELDRGIAERAQRLRGRAS